MVGAFEFLFGFGCCVGGFYVLFYLLLFLVGRWRNVK